MTNKIIHGLLLGALVFVGAQTFAADVEKVKEVPDSTPIPWMDGVIGRSAVLKKFNSRIQTPPLKIGVIKRGWFCGTSNDMVWNQALHNSINTYIGKVYKEQIAAAKYPTPVVSDSMFDTPKDKPSGEGDLQVGAMIKDVSSNVCADSTSVSGGAYFKIFWQVYSPASQKVVFETTTEGSYNTTQPEKTYEAIASKALARAVRGLFADPGFFKVIATTAEPESPSTPELQAIRMKKGRTSTDTVTKNITNIRAAMVTVFTDIGTGSGFFVSPDGYIITNQHVVGNSKFLKVKLVTGRELVGEVVRVDANRDVALIKTEPTPIQAFVARDSELNIGEEVYAIGSPKGDTFNTTLTKGILSGYRTYNNLRYVQSDVSVTHGNSGGPLLDSSGNVIGITDLGVLVPGGNVTLNLFIPIDEAISKLGIVFN